MEVVSIKVKVIVLKELLQEQSYYAIARLIDKTMYAQDKYKDMHESKEYKPYNFSGLSSIEKDGIYKKDRVYSFTIRTIDIDWAKYIAENIKKYETSLLKPYNCEIWIVQKKTISKVYSLTPMLIKREEGYLRNSSSIKDIEKIIFENLVKKYEYFSKKALENNDFNIWNNMVFLNRTPVKIAYKDGITLLGDKIEMSVDSNDLAQEIMYMALGVGIGENCSRGCGYINYHTLE